MGSECAAVNALVAVGCKAGGETDVGSWIVFVLHIVICAAELTAGVFESRLTEQHVEMVFADGLVVTQSVFNLPGEILVHLRIYAGAVGVVVWGEPKLLDVALVAPETHIAAEGRAEFEVVQQSEFGEHIANKMVSLVVGAG